MESVCGLRLSDRVFRDDDHLTRHPAHPQGFLFQRVPQTQLNMGLRPEAVQAMAYNYEQQLQNELEMLEREIYDNMKEELDEKIYEDEVPEPLTTPIRNPIKNVAPTKLVAVKTRKLPERRSCTSKQGPGRPLTVRDQKKNEPSQLLQCENTILAVRSTKRQIQRSLVCIQNSILLGYKREPIDPLDAQRQVRRNMEFKTRITRELYHFRRVVESVMEQLSKFPEEVLQKRCLGVYRRGAHLLSDILKHLPDYEEREALLSSVKEILNLLILLQHDKQFTNYLSEWCREAKVTKLRNDRKIQTINLKSKDNPASKNRFKEDHCSKSAFEENLAPKKVFKEDRTSRKPIKSRVPEKTFKRNLHVDDIVDEVDKRLLNRLGPMLKQISGLLEQQKSSDVRASIERIPGWHGFAEVFNKSLELSSNSQKPSKGNKVPVADKKTKPARAIKKTLVPTQAPSVSSLRETASGISDGERVGKDLQKDVEMHQLQQIMRRIEKMEKEEDAIRRRLGGIQYEAVSPESLVMSRIPQCNNIDDSCQDEGQGGRSIVVYSPECDHHPTQPPKPSYSKHTVKKTKDSKIKLKMDADEVDEIETAQLRYLKYLQFTEHLNRTPSVSIQQVQSVSENAMTWIWKEVEHEINNTLMEMTNTVIQDELWSAV